MRGFGAADTFAVLLAFSVGRPIFNADLYVIDGGSGKTRAVVDYTDLAHWLDQANTTNQCALPAAHADFAGQLCLSLDGAVPTWYQSTRSVAYWKYGHDGSGLDLAAAATWTAAGTRVLLSTLSSTHGFYLFRTDVAHVFNVYNTGGVRLSLTSPTVTLVPRIYQARHATAEDPDGTYKQTGAAQLTANYGGALSSADAQHPLTIGGNGTGGLAFTGRFRSLAVSPVLDASYRSIRNAWFEEDTGLAA